MDRLAVVLLVFAGCAHGPVATAMSAREDVDALDDVDRDAIAGADDGCPCHAEDVDGFEDTDGCPERDNDRDRRVDACDTCPNAREVYNGHEDFDGCPDEDVVVITASCPRVFSHIYFSRGSAQLDPSQDWLIDELVAVMRRYPREHFEVQGHAAENERNPRRIATRRAEAVRDRLIEGGIAPERLVARGYGADRLYFPPEHRDGPEENRRAEIHFIPREEPPQSPPAPPDPCDPPPPVASACPANVPSPPRTNRSDREGARQFVSRRRAASMSP